MEEQRIREALRRQQEMFDQAANGLFQIDDESFEEDDPLDEHSGGEGRQLFVQVLNHQGVVAPEFTQHQLDLMLQFILSQSEQSLISFL